MNIQRIFISIPWFTPAYKAGGPIQSILNLVTIPQENMEYFVFTSNRDLNNEKLENIESNNWYQFNEQTKVFYSKRVGRADVLMAQVKLVQPNVLYAIGLFNWHFNIMPIFFCRANKKILSVRGMLHTGALQQKALKKNLFLAFVKMMGLRQLSAFHATNEVELGFIKEVFGEKANIHLAANYPRLFQRSNPVLKTAGQLELVSICLISKMKNILLVIESLQFCEQTIHYHIHGDIKDAAYWQSCVAAIKNLPAHIKVSYHGALPASQVEGVLHEMHVYIQPSDSENYGHSMVEALSAGLPLITSENTPWLNLQEEYAGVNVVLHPTAISKAIDRFARMSQEEFDGMSAAAAAYIHKRVNLEETNQQYQKMFNAEDGH